MPVFKTIAKRTKHSTLLAVTFFLLIALIIALITLILIFARVITNQLKILNSNLKEANNTISTLSGNNNERLKKLTSAELLLNNTNLILKTVFFGTADTEDKEEAKDFTAFSMIYKDKFYIITAGHCVEMENIKYKNFKFKANYRYNWIYPDLILYNNDFTNNNDFAIFYDRTVTLGLIPAEPNEDMTPQYVLGNIERNLNIIRRYKDAKEGESGSPILNSKCHVIGILIKKDGDYTPIDIVLKALENIDKQTTQADSK